MKKYDTLVFICRCQPVHNAHTETIRLASMMADNVVVIVGSAGQPPSYKNPFTAEERIWMIRDALGPLVAQSGSKIHYFQNIDTIHNDAAWGIRIQEIVHKVATGKTGIIGHDKDGSSFYLKMFPQWAHEEVELLDPLDASGIRDLYFRERVNMNYIRSVVAKSTLSFLELWKDSKEYKQILRERAFLEEHDKQYVGLKYPPIFVTTDAVVMQSGHMLMIKRRAEPGRGLWAFPGGYLNAKTDKSLVDGMLRELREETGLKVPDAVIRGSIQSVKVFDAVDRSPRGRIITHAFKIVLPDGPLPKVKGADDAEKAKFREISSIRSDECFEDHFEIRQWAIGG
jgi:bifunctional NMN adenylyltransferase/nudix hydrolase